MAGPQNRGRPAAVAAGVLLALSLVAGCRPAGGPRSEPIRVVPARQALGGYRVPEYPVRPAPTPPPAHPTPPRTRPALPSPRPTPPTPAPAAGRRRAHPEWAVKHPRNWRYIVIHHSETDRGNAAIFDRYHREVRHWENGLGYHFVIGNGTDSGDGEVEVGSRWKKQLPGAHAGVWKYNQFGIGICLVGDFEKHPPTRKQIKALLELVDYLRAAYHIPRRNILRHSDIRNTRCPGRYFPFDELFRK